MLLGLAMVGLLGCGDTTGGASDATTDASTSGGSSSGSPTEGQGASTDASSSSGAGSDSASDSAATTSATTGAAVTCTSNKYWTMGEFESPQMHPGRACLTCHDTVVNEDIAGRLAIAGTVYPTAHEEDDCYGVDGGATGVTVEITTADQKTLTLPVNGSGNFLYDQLELGPIMFPIKAKVVRDGVEKVMAAPQMTGDCNSCHTETGMNGAPGRILAP